MATQYVKGSELMLFEKTLDNHTAFAFAKSHSLQIDAESLEVSSKDSGKWKEFLTTKLSWQIQAEHLYTADNYDSLVDKMIKREPIEIAFALATNADSDTGKPVGGWTAGKGWTGKAVITSISANANDGEIATYSITLQGASALTKKAS